MMMWLPEKTITFMGMVDRMSAATGDAMVAMDADFNGHPVLMSFKPEAMAGPTWTSHYTWSGIQYVGRGGFNECLETSIKFYERGGMGSSLTVTTYGSPSEQGHEVEILLHKGFVQYGGQHTRDGNRSHWPEWLAIEFWYRERKQGQGSRLVDNIQTSIEKGIEFPEPLPQTPQTHPRQIERWVRSLDVGRASRVAG